MATDLVVGVVAGVGVDDPSAETRYLACRVDRGACDGAATIRERTVWCVRGAGGAGPLFATEREALGACVEAAWAMCRAAGGAVVELVAPADRGVPPRLCADGHAIVRGPHGVAVERCRGGWLYGWSSEPVCRFECVAVTSGAAAARCAAPPPPPPPPPPPGWAAAQHEEGGRPVRTRALRTRPEARVTPITVHSAVVAQLKTSLRARRTLVESARRDVAAAEAGHATHATPSAVWRRPSSPCVPVPSPERARPSGIGASAEDTRSESAHESHGEPIDEPHGEPIDEPHSESTNESHSESVEKVCGAAVEDACGESAEKVCDASAGHACDASAEDACGESAEDACGESAEDACGESAEGACGESAEDACGESVEDVSSACAGNVCEAASATTAAVLSAVAAMCEPAETP